MIIEALLSVFSDLMHLLFDNIDIPDLPQSVHTALSDASSYIQRGLGFFASFCHWDFVRTIFLLAIGVEAVMLLYKFIVWLLKKIPMAGVS